MVYVTIRRYTSQFTSGTFIKLGYKQLIRATLEDIQVGGTEA